MTPWRHRPLSGPIPVVPNDEQERRAAIQQSADGLSDALRRVPEVAVLAESLSSHDGKNHYILRLREAYGGIGI